MYFSHINWIENNISWRIVIRIAVFRKFCNWLGLSSISSTIVHNFLTQSHIAKCKCSILGNIFLKVKRMFSKVLTFNPFDLTMIYAMIYTSLLHPQVIRGTFNIRSPKQIFYCFKYHNKMLKHGFCYKKLFIVIKSLPKKFYR